MSRFNLAWLIGIPLVVLLGLTLTYSAPPIKDKEHNYELVKLLVDVLAEVDQSYVRELDPEQKRRLVEDMINGGLERLDPNSSFFSIREYKHFVRKSKGHFGGVGSQVNLDRNTGALIVTSPMVGTPAYEAGILAGDLILKIDGKSLETVRPAEAVEMIQGQPGTAVTLTVLHEGTTKPVDVPIVRAVIEVETVLGDRRKPERLTDWEYVIDPARKIAYVRVIEFDEPTAGALKTVLTQLQTEGVRGLVLDLRGNPGGLLSSAVAVSDLFLTEGTIVSTRGRRLAERVYTAKADGTLFEPAATHPIAVLIDRYSASASEIVASALQDHGRAVVGGERSYGKGSVQNVFPLENETTALKLTTQSYWRPNGKNIHRFPDSKDSDDWGIKPSPGYEVPLSIEDRKAYLEWRQKRDIVFGKPGAGQQAADRKPPEFKDKVLERALDYLRTELDKQKSS
jgi:carboxyl-terminal processing protease